MLWSHKYKYIKPSVLKDLVNLNGLNMIIYGPSGGSKHNYVEEYIRHIIKIKYEDWHCKMYHINAEKKIDINLYVRQSRLHVECYLDEFGNYHKHFVRHIIKPIVSNLTIATDGHICSKLIVIYNIHYLSVSSQQELRKLTEKFMPAALFIFVTDKLGSVIKQLTSSFILYRISRPSTKELKTFVNTVVLEEEKTTMSVKCINQQIEKQNNHISNTLNGIQFLKKHDDIEKILLKLCKNIIKGSFQEIRDILYILMVNNTHYNDILKFVVLFFKSYEITQNASIYSHKMVCCERVIYHLEAFTNGCVKTVSKPSLVGTKGEKYQVC